MRRREFIIAVAMAPLAGSRIAHGQQPAHMARMGVLGTTTLTGSDPRQFEQFGEGLRANGLIEGQNLTIDWRWAEGDAKRLPQLAAELIALKPDVIVAAGDQAMWTVKGATHTIPIVAPIMSDPVGQGRADRHSAHSTQQ
jgi:putative ABC transport system substrate-binding protein